MTGQQPHIKYLGSVEEIEAERERAEAALEKFTTEHSIPGMIVGRDKDGRVVNLTLGKWGKAGVSIPATDADRQWYDLHASQHEQMIDPDNPDKFKKPKNDEAGCTSCNEGKLKRLITGGAKLLKSELGIGAADAATITERRGICEACPALDFGVCTDCGCFAAAKVKLKAEQCPREKW